MNYAAETSLGVVTIRAFKMGHMFFHNYLKLVDIDARLFFHSNATMEWLIIRTEALQNLTFFVEKLVEYEEPSKLLDTNSYFSKLVAEYWSSCRIT
ncbi:hypothetical protein ACE6H2_007003 [Prunus campanulata]